MFGLFASTRFTPLFVTQFSGAMNDNLYKNAFAVLLVYVLAPAYNYDAKILVNITQAIFILPYIFFAAMAGSLGDIYDKALIIRRIKLAEIFIVMLAIAALYLKNIPMLMFIVFLLSVQSAFFGPVKYSIIPHHIPQHLVNANALITAGTFLAIISGTILGGYFASIDGGIIWLAVGLLTLAAIGYIAARSIPEAPPISSASLSQKDVLNQGSEAQFSYNFIAAIGKLLGYIFTQHKILIALLFGVSWFWFVGSVLITQIPIITGEYLMLEGISVSLFMLMFACGIGTGAIMCSLFMKGKATDRLASVTSILMGIMILETGLAIAQLDRVMPAAATNEYLSIGEFLSNWQALRLCMDFTLVSILGGCYVLPIFALLQSQALPKERARVIAANNIMNAAFMVSAAI
ncbi:MAG: MFS transporter [Gammaproteobacteria bacterium]|nr:MFS transporter [Gammaproteobacteria bacterium]